MKKVAIIGSGFSGLSAACYAAKAGHEVQIFEKNTLPGGRARQFKTDNGYTFDMGPSWYWMPDIFERFFADFGKKTTDYYTLISLNPQFEIVFEDEVIALPAAYEDMKNLFDSIDPGSSVQLELFMKDAEKKYAIAMHDFVEKPCHSWFEFISLKIAKSAFSLNLLSDFKSFIRKFFRHPKLITIMEFPVIFLGAMPDQIPAMYSLMNFGGYKMGTWYPVGGFGKVTDALVSLAEELGVKIHYNSEVQKILIRDKAVNGLLINGEPELFDAVISTADYHFTETKLLDENQRNYQETYWAKRTFAPSALIFYVGLSIKLPALKHHTLFFEHELYQHADEIYNNKKWPTAPLFYVCCPSQTDSSVAHEGHENLFFLMPLATGIEDSEAMRETYFREMITRLEKHTGLENISGYIDYKRSYCLDDFKQDYNAYQGNAYGLANTLLQTAFLKPALKNRKINNLYYAGQLTVPGPGVPPALISGKIAAKELNQYQ